MKHVGIMLLLVAGALAAAGLLLLLGDRFHFLGRLPGDFHFQKKDFHFHFPLATCLLLSIVLTIVLNIVTRLMHR